MLKQLIGMGLLASVLLSCSSDVEELDLQQFSLPDSLKDLPAIDYEALFSPTASQTSITPIRTKGDVDVDEETITVYGCDRTEVKKKAKVSLNKASAAVFDLSEGIYIIEYVLCYKNVYKPGYDIWSEPSERCGYKPADQFVLGNEDIAMTKERGYGEPESNAKEIKTFLLHVVSDVYGKKVNRYSPCTPNEIEWTYSRVPQS